MRARSITPRGLAAAAATILLAASACDRHEPGRVEAPGAPVEVVVSEVGSAAGTVAFPAEVVSDRKIEVATRASGLVRRVPVDVGSAVRAGQLLVELETDDVGSAIDAAQAAVKQASRYHERIAALEADGAATPQELDDAEARLAGARAELARARNQMRYVRLTAPIAGVVTVRGVDPGDLVVPGQPAVTLVGTGALVIRADLPAEHAGIVHPGSEVTVVVPSSGARVRARVTRVVPALESGTRRFRVEAAFEPAAAGGRILPGSYARLEIERGGDPTRWVPRDALVRRGQLTGVYVVEDDTLRLRWVRTGQARPDAVEILAGVPAGARLVRRPDPALADGLAVRAVEREAWRLRPLADARGAPAPGPGDARPAGPDPTGEE